MTPTQRIIYLRDVEKWRWRQIAQVMSLTESNARARYHAAKAKPAPAAKKRTRRPCMRCRKTFWSTGPGNRMCDDCRRVAENVSPYDPGIPSSDGWRQIEPHFNPERY